MKKIGIIVAMDEEFDAVEKIIEFTDEKEIRKVRFKKGYLGDVECILACCGIGKVNSARTTQLLIDNFDVQYIMNVGVAGAIKDDLNVGDILIGKHTVQHDFDITAFGHSKGYISGIGNNVKCDEELNMKVIETIKNIEERQYKIKVGVIATGDMFCTDIAMKDKISAIFGADCVDMECGAIAQVALLNDIPFFVMRSISDSPNGKNEKNFEENLPFACRRFANVLREFLIDF